jgi:hypothetical protein
MITGMQKPTGPRRSHHQRGTDQQCDGPDPFR